MSPPRHSGPRGVNHPNFTRISPTIYRLRDPTYPISTTIHVAQIAEFLKFDEEIRRFHHSSRFNSYPLGYLEFTRIWNDGVPDGDPRRISTLLLVEDIRNNDAEPSQHPVHLSDFHITAAQVGLDPDDPRRAVTSSQDAAIVHEYATLMADKQRKQREFVEERRQQRIRAFDSGRLPPFRAPERAATQRLPKKHAKKPGMTKRSTPPSEHTTTSETSPTQPEGAALGNPASTIPMETAT